jgi:uncharacterized membrane protein YgcG
MVQPQYLPQEALDRIKLMMKYDTSKTLNENVETIKQPVNEVAPLVIPAITIAAPWLWAAGATAAAAVGAWIYKVQGGGDAFSKTQTFLQGCSSLDKNLKPTQSKGDHREAADSIYNAIQGIGTDEDAIKGAISSMETVADLCAMAKYYNKVYGDLYDDLDSDIDGEDFRKYVWSAIAPIVDDAEEDLAKSKEEGGKEEGDGKKKKGGGGGTGGGYKPCSGSYTKGCKSDAIAKVQGCLGLVTDGKFGPKTEAALKAKGFSSFTDAEVDKICNKPTTTPTVDSDEEDVDGVDPNQI